MIEFAIYFLKQNWKTVAYITFFVLIFGAGYYKGYEYEKSKFDKHLQTDATLLAVAKAENERKLREQQSITDNVTKEYANAIKKLNDYYRNSSNVKWMQPRCDSKAVSEISNTTSEPDGKTKGYQVDTTGIDPIDCASDVLQLLYLQKWIKDQSLIQ